MIDNLTHAYEMEWQEERLKLNKDTFRLLECLTACPSKVYSREELADYVGAKEELDYVLVLCRIAREKIEVEPWRPKWLMTKWREGFYWNGPCYETIEEMQGDGVLVHRLCLISDLSRIVARFVTE